MAGETAYVEQDLFDVIAYESDRHRETRAIRRRGEFTGDEAYRVYVSRGRNGL